MFNIYWGFLLFSAQTWSHVSKKHTYITQDPEKRTIKAVTTVSKWMVDMLISPHVRVTISWWDFKMEKMLQIPCGAKAKVFFGISRALYLTLLYHNNAYKVQNTLTSFGLFCKKNFFFFWTEVCDTEYVGTETLEGWQDYKRVSCGSNTE